MHSIKSIGKHLIRSKFDEEETIKYLNKYVNTISGYVSSVEKVNNDTLIFELEDEGDYIGATNLSDQDIFNIYQEIK